MSDSDALSATARLLALMQRLREDCPWDKAQDFTSLTRHTLEEAYEVVDAVEKGDMRHLQEELGDLLLQVVFYAQIAEEAGHFNFAAVAQGVSDKLERRHPQLFGAEAMNAPQSSADQEAAWEAIKQREKAELAAERSQKMLPLGEVPLALPALTRAALLQKNASKQGFDWQVSGEVLNKLDEEIKELREAIAFHAAAEEVQAELGDVLFCCVGLARHLRLDPETTMRAANRKFERRFSVMHAELGVQQRRMQDASAQELSDLWDQAKIAERLPGQVSLGAASNSVS